MVYDASDHYMVLFGGVSPKGVLLNDTWICRNESWTELHPAISPPVREWASIAYDAADGYVILFGGWSNPWWVNDTWSFHAGAWTNRTTPGFPAPSWRSAAAMTYDEGDGYVVLFGGFPNPFGWGTAGDTWKYSGGNWTDLTATLAAAPRDRMWPGITYDPLTSSVLMFAGSTCPPTSCDGYGGYPLNDTWSFSNGSWTNVTPALSPRPQPTPVLTYFSLGGCVLLENAQGATWEFLNGSWTNLSLAITPGIRLGATIAEDPSLGIVMLLDGEKAYYDAYNEAVIQFGGVYNDSWAFAGPGSTLPLVVRVTAPAVVDLNQTLTVTVQASGGSGLYAYNLTNLPPPCLSSGSGASVVSCRPERTGTYNVTGIVKDSAGNQTTAAARIVVAALPAVSLQANRTQIDVNQSIRLTVTVVEGLAPVTVNFSGLPPGCSAAGLSFVCSTAVPGVYGITATASDGTGASTTSNSVAVAVNPALVVGRFVVFGLSGHALGVTIVANYSGGTPPYSFYYDFGDGTTWTSNDSSTTHVYGAAGTKTVAVAVTDATGVNRSARASFYLSVPPKPLTGNLSFAPSMPEVSGALSIAANVTGGYPVYSYNWTGLPLGCTATNTPAVSCTPTAGATTLVQLVVRDSGPDVTTASASLTVMPKLNASIDTTTLGGCGSPLIWIFSAQGSGGWAPYRYLWDLGVSDTSESNSSSVVAGVVGHNVTLTVTDATGAMANDTIHPSVAMSCPAQLANTSPVGIWLLIGAGVGAGVTLASVVTFWRLRKRS